MSPRRAVFLIGLLAALAAAGGLRARDDGPVVERGTFVLHLYKRPTGKETYEIGGVAELAPGKRFTVKVTSEGGPKEFVVTTRIDTPNELDYFRHGGIMQFVLRSLK